MFLIRPHGVSYSPRSPCGKSERTTRARGLSVALAVVLVTLPGLAAPSTPGAEDLRVGPVYLEDFPTVRVVVEPPDHAGKSSLAPEDLVLLEDGVATGAAREIVPFGELGRGTAVLVAVDVSGTMDGTPLEQIRSALLRLMRESSPEDRLALVTFADDVRVESPFGAPREDLAAAIQGLSTRGSITELYLAAFQALDLLDVPGLPERRRLLVISDGKDEGEAWELEDVVERAEARRIAVDAIGLTRIDPRYLSNLRRLSALTGGTYVRARDASELEALVQEGHRQLAATPVATFRAQRLTADGQPHDLGVRVTRDGRSRQGTVPVLLPAPPAAKQGNGDAGNGDAGNGDAGRGTASAAEGGEPAPAWPSWLPPLLGIVLVLVLLGVWGRLRRSRSRTPSGAPPDHPGEDAEAEGSVAAETSPPDSQPGDSLEATVAEAAPDDGPAAAPPPSRSTRFSPVFPRPTPGNPAALLVGEEGPAAGRRVPLESDPFWIGAAEEADLPVAGDDFLSSFHASIQFHEGSLLLHDDGSTNGTFLNGSRLGASQQPLSPGDRIRVGRSVFVLQLPPP